MLRSPVLVTVLLGLLSTGSASAGERYVRYADGQEAHYGRMVDERIRELDRAPWLGGRETGQSVARAEVKLLAPAEPSKVFAVGFNYMSHRGDQKLPEHPPIFLKLPSTITGPGADIVYPPDAGNVHYEAEMVIVIGKQAHRMSPAEAADAIFGVTAGDDVSERDWQANDLQWFRGKATDTFGPIGPAVVTGLDYDNLLVQSRLNGKVMQSQRTSDLIHGAREIVSFISQYSTLEPGDLIFSGTPGATSAMQPGDMIEIEVEGVGVLRNTITRGK